MSEITAALITAVFAFMGTALTVFCGRRSTEKSIAKNADVIVYRLDRLEEKVNSICEAIAACRERKTTDGARQPAALRRI